ncbi:ribonuclease H-like domain-containing protein [Chaetomium strumarium]|uniref:Ribonuclease H-like domain-containing protein n=1 Tax=Chaetomium strumarium TaxID=1170767 RepID=A0AAJ0LYK9_9PEZI|nr:ribonuclease H-like domain-containing protein [Chaetomium strumarium]
METTAISGRSSSKAVEHTETAAYYLAAEAAKTFQILQFGLTCLSYDRELNAYRAQTFTFYLTPEFTPPSAALAGLIDRKVVLSYQSFLLLKENNLLFGKAFSEGVPYLSRSEEELVNSLYLSNGRQKSAAYTGHALDTRTRQFYNDTRMRERTILADTEDTKGDSLLITNPEGPSKQLLPSHIWVIRRLVRTEFPSCFVILRRSNALAQVIKWDPEERASIPVDVLLSHQHTNKGSSSNTSASQAHATQLRSDLRLHESRIKTGPRPVLISHNPLLDLCFLVQTFLCPLPTEVTAFRRDLHAHFPRIVDTRHLSSQLGFRTGKNLEALYGLVGGQGGGRLPIVPPEPRFDARSSVGGAVPHDAGFGSWMTAVVFVSLARKVTLRNPRLLWSLDDEERERRKAEEQHGSASASAPISPLGKGKDVLFPGLTPSATSGGARERPGSRLAAIGLIPQWDSEVWRRYGNRLWLGDAGVMDLTRA